MVEEHSPEFVDAGEKQKIDFFDALPKSPIPYLLGNAVGCNIIPLLLSISISFKYRGYNDKLIVN